MNTSTELATDIAESTKLYGVKGNAIFLAILLACWLFFRCVLWFSDPYYSLGMELFSSFHTCGVPVLLLLLYVLLVTVTSRKVDGRSSGRVKITEVGPDDHFCETQAVHIPNTILSVFTDATRSNETIFITPWLGFNRDMRELGFYIEPINNEYLSQGHGNADDPEAIDAKNLIVNSFATLWNDKKLHGVLLRGHGGPDGFGVGSNYSSKYDYAGPRTRIAYSEVLLFQKYKLAAVLPIGCYPDNANTRALGQLMWGAGITTTINDATIWGILAAV